MEPRQTVRNGRIISRITEVFLCFYISIHDMSCLILCVSKLNAVEASCLGRDCEEWWGSVDTAGGPTAINDGVSRHCAVTSKYSQTNIADLVAALGQVESMNYKSNGSGVKTTISTTLYRGALQSAPVSRFRFQQLLTGSGWKPTVGLVGGPAVSDPL